MTVFRKMCASGNDFILIDERSASETQWQPEVVRKICDRKYGVGADQLLILRPSHMADVQMLVYNADGSRAQQCGNGLRATAAYLLRSNTLGQTSLTIHVGENSLHKSHMLNGDVFTVNMGWPVVIASKADSFQDFDFENPLHINSGNHHLIVWVKELSDIAIDVFGPRLQKHFDEPINIHFVKKVEANEIRIRHWEHGVGETLSCGSGIVSAVFAGEELGLLQEEVLVRAAQEEIFVEKQLDGYYLKGRVYSVFDGRLRFKV